jgi:hypothetical protein
MGAGERRALAPHVLDSRPSDHGADVPFCESRTGQPSSSSLEQRSMRLGSNALIPATLALLVQFAAAQAPVDVALRTTACSTVGGTVRVNIHATSQSLAGSSIGAIDVLLAWNPAELELLGNDDTQASYAWLISGFLPDPDNINANLHDGDGLYTALARPRAAAVAPPAQGMLVTSLLFRPLVALPLGSEVTIVPSQGTFATTRVLSFVTAGLVITGNLGPNGAGYTCPIGTQDCAPSISNSTGLGGLVTITGSPSVLENNLVLTASQLPSNAFGYFLCSRLIGPGTIPPGSQGRLCLLSPIGRGVGGVVFSTGHSGTGTATANLMALPQPTGPVAVLAGESWSFQAWHRDANPLVTSNFTDAVTVLFE